MRRLVYLDSARDDFQEIFRYITRQSGNRATGRSFVRQLRDQCVHLADLPGILGTQRPELRDDLRSFAHRGYVLFFRYVGDRLDIVNVIEGHRDIDAMF